VRISCSGAKDHFKYESGSFLHFWLKKFCYVCWLFICLNYCSWCADCVIAFGYNCSSMDALSKAFYTKEASYWGATFTSLLYDFLARKFRISFDHDYILHLHICVYICLWFEFPLFDCEFLQELMNVNSLLEPLQDQFSFKWKCTSVKLLIVPVGKQTDFPAVVALFFTIVASCN